MIFIGKMLRKVFSNKKGQAMVEFAVILPLFVFLFAGITYMGMVFHDYLSITFFAREAARASAVGTTNAAIIADATANRRLVLTNLYSVNLNRTSDFNIGILENEQLGGNYVTVTVTARRNARNSLPLIDSFLPAALTSRLSMRVETNAPN